MVFIHPYRSSARYKRPTSATVFLTVTVTWHHSQFYMFDNAYHEANGTFVSPYSRMLIVEVDNDANTATLVWEYNMGYQVGVSDSTQPSIKVVPHS